MGNYSIELKQGDFPFHYLKSGQISDVRHKSRSVPDLSAPKLPRSRIQPEIHLTLVVSDWVGASSCAGYCRVGSVQGVLSDTTRTNPNPDCKGQITLIFPADSSNASFDFSVKINHDVHPGREYFGMPLVVREWILKNPRQNSTIQREELQRAIDRGELPNIPKVYLRPMNIHYWNRKATKDKIFRSKDSWENVYHILKEHPMVSSRVIRPLTIGNQRYLPYCTA
jgi:hypothetical protein